METKLRSFLIVAATAAAIIGFSLGFSLAHGATKAEVEEFIDEPNCKPHNWANCYATLVVACADGKRIRFKVNRKRLDMLDVEGLYAIIYQECNKE